jgi:ABC-2 type transport system permease protein
MIQDIGTLIWKEWKEIFLRQGRNGRGWKSIAIIIGLLGIYFPLMSEGYTWFESPVALIPWAWMPVYMVIGQVADSFAGERERHTLETLLATRLSDSVILLGKILSAVLYGWMIAFLSLVVGAITVNIARPAGTIQFYPLDVFFGGLFLVLIGAFLMSVLGVLVSLKAESVRQAYQKLGYTILGLFLLPTIIVQVLPKDIKVSIDYWIYTHADFNFQYVLYGVVAAVIIADVVLYFVAKKKFKRDELVCA